MSPTLVTFALLGQLFGTQEPSDLQRTAALLSEPGAACYTVARGRHSTPLRENYFTYSPVLDQLKTGQVFIGHRVAGENKVLVMTPNARGPIGVVRHTFTQELPAAACTDARRLYAPGTADLKGWGLPLPGQPELPAPPGGVRSSYGCYQKRAGGTPMWGTREVSESGRYAERVTLIEADGSDGAKLPRATLQRLPLVRCSGPI